MKVIVLNETIYGTLEHTRWLDRVRWDTLVNVHHLLICLGSNSFAFDKNSETNEGTDLDGSFKSHDRMPNEDITSLNCSQACIYHSEVRYQKYHHTATEKNTKISACSYFTEHMYVERPICDISVQYC